MLLYQTHAKIHLNNICTNIENIKRKIGSEHKILIAVKANAYGHGAVEVSRMAQDHGVDYLGVATIPEGIQLRKASISLPILKFSPSFPEELEAALEYNITLAVCSLENAIAIQELARKTGKTTSVHLKIDTGMGRVGISPENIPEFVEKFKKLCPNLFLEGVFSHFPVSDMPEFDSFTSSQIDVFATCVTQLESALNSKIPLKHFANSGGVLGHPNSYFSMVRPGIMIYGFYPDKTTPHSIDLLPGMSLFSRVSHLKMVKANTPIGYGKTWVAPSDTFIATIPAGYADGLNRLLSNRGAVIINERKYPIIGRICMDQTMINLGSETDIKVGDKVTLIGREGKEYIGVEDWARLLGTITYEVTCQISGRVERIYEY